MNINLSGMQQHTLAKSFAGAVHAQAIRLHLKAVAKLDSRPDERASFADDEIREMRHAIRSIRDKRERESFVGTVRFLFHQMRLERGTEPTTRAYIAKVLAYRERMAA